MGNVCKHPMCTRKRKDTWAKSRVLRIKGGNKSDCLVLHIPSTTFVCFFFIKKYSQAQTNTLMLFCICNGTSTSDIRNVMAESEAMMNDGGMGGDG
jgi:hypothetical protein